MSDWANSIAARIHERIRQAALTTTLGQVHCSFDEEAHAAENLPCTHCGAAL